MSNVAGWEAVARRTPFSDSGVIGVRGLRTRQRILESAVRVLGESGYEGTSVESIASGADCSRVAVYQYFEDKADIFRELAGQAARQLGAAAEALGPVTATAAGRAELLRWVEQYGRTHARYQPLYSTFGAALDADPALADRSARVGARLVELFQANIVGTDLAARDLDSVVAVMHATLPRVLDIAASLRAMMPEQFPESRVAEAFTDVFHRSLFGLVPGVNGGESVRPQDPSPASRRPVGDAFERAQAVEIESRRSDRRALAALLRVGEDVVAARGYRGTRVEDIVAAAGVSRGSFYTYFADKDEYVRLIVARALQEIVAVLDGIPDVVGDSPERRADVQRWIRRYEQVSSTRGAVVRAWVEAGGSDDLLQADNAAALDWGRRRLVRSLRGREFGDVDADALVMLVVVGGFGARPRTANELDAAFRIIDSGIVGSNLTEDAMGDQRPRRA